jgi:hypothetical protein
MLSTVLYRARLVNPLGDLSPAFLAWTRTRNGCDLYVSHTMPEDGAYNLTWTRVTEKFLLPSLILHLPHSCRICR